MAEVIASPEFAAELFKQIEEQGSIIEAASGSTEAGKRKIANDTAAETEAVWGKSLSQLTNALEKIDDPKVLVGALTGVTTGLREKFQKLVDEWLEKEVEARKSDTPSVSAEALAQAQETRRDLVDQYKAVVTVLTMFGHKEEDFPTPKRLTGPRGPQGERGPRIPKNMQFAIDGKDRSATQNNLSSIFQTVVKGSEGCDELKSTKDFKQYLKDTHGFDFENVPSEFSYTLPNGKVLSGRLTDDVVDDEDEDTEEVSTSEE